MDHSLWCIRSDNELFFTTQQYFHKLSTKEKLSATKMTSPALQVQVGIHNVIKFNFFQELINVGPNQYELWATGAVGTCDWTQILFAYGYYILILVIILNICFFRKEIWVFWKDLKKENIEFLRVGQKRFKQESRNENFNFFIQKLKTTGKSCSPMYHLQGMTRMAGL